jgi:hypothetical protein
LFLVYFFEYVASVGAADRAEVSSLVQEGAAFSVVISPRFFRAPELRGLSIFRFKIFWCLVCCVRCVFLLAACLVMFLLWGVWILDTHFCGLLFQSRDSVHSPDFFVRNAFVLLAFCYQLGVFISRSSLQVVRIRRVEVLTVIQVSQVGVIVGAGRFVL